MINLLTANLSISSGRIIRSVRAYQLLFVRIHFASRHWLVGNDGVSLTIIGFNGTRSNLRLVASNSNKSNQNKNNLFHSFGFTPQKYNFF